LKLGVAIEFSSVRSDIIGAETEYGAPDGAGFNFGCWYYKDVAPTALTGVPPCAGQQPTYVGSIPAKNRSGLTSGATKSSAVPRRPFFGLTNPVVVPECHSEILILFNGCA
jgi:hypothetical protein